jgi:glyoxylate reductase
MRELFDDPLNVDDRPMTQAELVEAVKRMRRRAGADRHRPHRRRDRHRPHAVAGRPAMLKLIANFGNGVDNIDVEARLQRGITVTNTPAC